MKLLSICIPTYNRNKALKELSTSFLVPALNAYSDIIDVIVCDNSDGDVAFANKSLIDDRILYFKNKENMGFAGNLLRCTAEANATYIWIISDDDPILWQGFVEFIEMLSRANLDGIDCIMLPFQTTNVFGDTKLSNRQIDWHDGNTQDTSVDTLLRSGIVPFILFSSAAIRLDKSELVQIQANYAKNDYLQVILFLSMLNSNSQVRYVSSATIDYHPEYQGRFSITSLAGSMSIVRNYLKKRFGVLPDEKRDYRGWLLWLVHHRGGLYRIKGADKDRWIILAGLRRNLDFKNILLAFAIILPVAILRPLYVWYRSLQDMQGRFRISELLERISSNKKFILNNVRET